MNISDIAKRAKVSTATVSRTINGSDRVSPETAKKVWKVVRSLGYQPSSYARAMVSGRSHLLGLIISDITNPFFPELVKTFEEIAIRNGMEVIVANTSYDPERMLHGVQRMIERKAEGVAVMTSEMDENSLTLLQTRRIPLVFLDTGEVAVRTSNIRVDYDQGINEAVEHLVQFGHRRIGFIAGPLEHSSALARQTSFVNSLAKRGLQRDKKLIQAGNFQIDGGASAMDHLLRLAKHPTAVLASNDLTAIGAMRTIHRAGLRIPEDISIVGFDDIAFSQLTQPALTTIRLSREELAQQAYDALTTMIRDKTQRGRLYKVGTRLVMRDSTANPPSR